MSRGCPEFHGHMLDYGAIDIVDERQSESVRALLSPLAEQGLLMWEWADPLFETEVRHLTGPADDEPSSR
jgi:hypothetical protein